MATASKEPSTGATESSARDALAKEAAIQTATQTRTKDQLTTKDVPPTNSINNNNASVRVEIFDQVYNLRGSDADYILKLAEYVDGKMRAVSQQTATVDSVRLAVLAALNIADEFHLLKRTLESPSPEARQRAIKLASALDEVLQDTRRTG
jgi:cell division protein ZapA